MYHELHHDKEVGVLCDAGFKKREVEEKEEEEEYLPSGRIGDAVISCKVGLLLSLLVSWHLLALVIEPVSCEGQR